MELALGIDTGGTFTDSVIFDLLKQDVVVKAKANTTYEDLALGIRNSLNNLHIINPSEIKLVALSTTMATNAIVEGRGSEVGLILIGEVPNDALPVKHMRVVGGGHDIKGNPVQELDLKEVQQAIEELNQKVDAIAISGFASVRNPEHELIVKDLVQQRLQLPVVCGHELTTSLGFHERTVTAVLNAKLIPIITNLIGSVKKVLAEKGIDAQLMIVKGDGTLMSEAMALEKPIETILSGPAASLIGALTLTDTSEALILDIGGTTTDIAILQQGIPRINPEGALVGGWLTRVEAADISTFGIGGDSYIRVNKEGDLLLGPQKVWPLSFVGARYPYLLEELAEQWENRNRLRASDVVDSYLLISKYKADTYALTRLEKRIIEILESGPHTLTYLARATDKSPLTIDLEGLVKRGLVAKVAVTPTDILHVKGIFQEWDQKIATQGVNMLANIMGISNQEVMDRIINFITDNLCSAILTSVLNFERAPKETQNDIKMDYLIKKALKSYPNEIINITPKLKIPIIGIGAPAEAYLPMVAKKLNAELIIPANADVANAIGAVTGKVMETVRVLIKPTIAGWYLYSQWERKKFFDLDRAKEYALELGEKQVRLLAEKVGTKDYKIIKDCRDKYLKGDSGPHLETIVEVTIMGIPNW